MKLITLILILIYIAFTPHVFAAEVIEDGKTVKLNYVLTVGGEEVESTEGRDPLEYVHGTGAIINGLERQLAGMSVGDEKTITVKPEEGYGFVNPNAFKAIPKSKLPADVEPTIGSMLRVQNNEGRRFPVMIWDIKEDTVVLNFNHPFAGKELKFDVTIVDIQ